MCGAGVGLGVRAPPGGVAAAAAAEREGIETVSVTNVVSAPAINKIGSLFNTLNKTVTGALNSIIAGAPVAPGGAQTQPMSTALSPLPAWRVPQQRPQGLPPDLQHVQLQRVRPPTVPQHHPGPRPLSVVRTISYESAQHHQQYTVPSSAGYFHADAPPPAYHQPASLQVNHVPAAQITPATDWYGHSTALAMVNNVTQPTGEHQLLDSAFALGCFVNLHVSIEK